MDETKTPSLDEMLDQPRLRETDRQTASFRAAAAAAEAMKTEDDKHAEAEAEDLIDRLKKGRGRHPHNIQTPPREEAYPELAKGKLLFQCEEYEAPKEYITLSMKEDKSLIKKILDQKGSLTGHPEIPVNGTEWDLPDLDCIMKAVNEEFPDAKLVAEKGDRVAELIGKYMGNVHVEFTCDGKLLVRGTRTKFKRKKNDERNEREDGKQGCAYAGRRPGCRRIHGDEGLFPVWKTRQNDLLLRPR